MESKTRIWRRKLSEKAITKERVLELERSLKNLNEQLSSARNESDAKDALIGKQSQVAEEAIAGWKKAEAEALSFKLELDDALRQKVIAEEKVTNIDAALKECVQRLNALKEEQHRTVNDASVNLLQEREKTQVLEERLADASQRLQQLSVEKNNLCGILDMKEKFIKDLNVSKSRAETDFAALVERFDFSEKSNESLKYEVRMLQKELVIRNQEREFNLRSAECAQKQHQESARKINRLESECHRLRVMIRKRLPGPAAIAKMRSEVEMLGNSVPETRRNSNYTMDSCLHFAQEIGHDALSKQLVRLHGIEDENKILKESLKKKSGELQLSRIMFARTASKLSQAEKQLRELSKGSTCLEVARNSSVTNELPLASVSEHGGNKDAVRCPESWESAFMFQLEHFRIGKPAIGSLQSSLMDDFEEMEKLAIVCADKPEEGSSIEEYIFLTPKSLDLKPELLESMSKELVPVEKLYNSGEFDLRGQSCFIQYEKYPTWLQDILKVIVEKHYTTQLNLDVILLEVRTALNKNKTTVKAKPLDPFFVGDNACQGPCHSSFTSADGLLGTKKFLPSETGNQPLQSKIENALHRIIDLTEGFIPREMPVNDGENLISLNDRHIDPRHKLASSTMQKTCIFFWESSELTMVLQRFIDACYVMLCKQAEVEKFVCELASTLGWISDHCFSLQDVSEMEETIKKNFGGDLLFWDDDTEVEVNSSKGVNCKAGAHDKFKVIRDGLYILSKMGIIGSKLRDENRKLKHQMANVEYGKKNLEEILKSVSAKNHSITRFKEYEKCISNLQTELRTLKGSSGLDEDQKLVSQDLGNQLTDAKVELNETRQKFSSLEAELEEKSNYCEELKERCLELQLQIESASDKYMHKFDTVLEEKELRTDWEISAASEKLAECQETILELGKQLKALASPKNATLLDNLISSPAIVRHSRTPQLLEQVIAVDNAKFVDIKSPQTKEIISGEPQKTDASFLNGQKGSLHFVLQNQESSNRHGYRAKSPDRSPAELGGSYTQKCGVEVGTLVSIPKKQKGGIHLLKKLLSRKKKIAIRSWS
ncbi:hypothetical protein KFK09_013057 [Dendrobium nobile]|uniref:Filament-like plant protein 7 n=1 Tax=Dendrobium nobile TaxID=94219 RepID=A0A8T3BMK1_DENNO|nr:hypothetical protein KFK09_013057 [Dendrobium nobile]